MRIAFVDSWLQQVAEGSGTAAAIGGLGRALQAAGHRVTRVAPLHPWPTNLTARRLLFNLYLPSLIGQLPYDLVVGFDIDGVALARRRGGPPYLCSVKGVIAEELQHERGRVRALLWGLSRLEWQNVRRASRTITTSAYCREALVRHYGADAARIALVPEGIELARWARLRSARPRSGATILCVARQYPRKRVQDLIAAMPMVRAAVPHARAVIVGDGPEHGALRELVARLDLGAAVELRGALPDAEVEQCYREADLFCLPSVQEGFGIVFLEAMAAGLPIVATASAAIPEVVPAGQAGLLVPPRNPQALAEALIALLTQPRQRAASAEFAAAYVARYDWPLISEQFLAVARSAE